MYHCFRNFSLTEAAQMQSQPTSQQSTGNHVYDHHSSNAQGAQSQQAINRGTYSLVSVDQSYHYILKSLIAWQILGIT